MDEAVEEVAGTNNPQVVTLSLTTCTTLKLLQHCDIPLQFHRILENDRAERIMCCIKSLKIWCGYFFRLFGTSSFVAGYCSYVLEV
jgi:hypothetical protein